jgi:hypothetical protein
MPEKHSLPSTERRTNERVTNIRHVKAQWRASVATGVFSGSIAWTSPFGDLLQKKRLSENSELWAKRSE